MIAAAGSRSANVLVVEDEVFLREVIAECLQEAGFEVASVGDGDAGLAVLQSGASVDVLLSDVRLPGISGYELAAAGQALRPDMKMILMTGYAPILPSALEPSVYRVLQKPFRIDSLAGVIAAALDGAADVAT